RSGSGHQGRGRDRQEDDDRHDRLVEPAAGGRGGGQDRDAEEEAGQAQRHDQGRVEAAAFPDELARLDRQELGGRAGGGGSVGDVGSSGAGVVWVVVHGRGGGAADDGTDRFGTHAASFPPSEARVRVVTVRNTSASVPSGACSSTRLCGVPSAAARPWSSTLMRSQSAEASSMEWVESRTVPPSER